MVSATMERAHSTSSEAIQPKPWVVDAGFPKVPSEPKQALIFSMTRGSTGVVDALSKYAVIILFYLTYSPAHLTHPSILFHQVLANLRHNTLD